MSNLPAISSVTLAVRDLDRVARFYCDTIGLLPLETGPDSLWLGAGDVRLLRLLHRPDFRPVDPAAAGLFHTAFLLPTRADLGRWLRHARDTGVALGGAADHLVSEAVYLADPEGNGVEIYADRPSSGWRWRDGHVVMANERLNLPDLMAQDGVPWTGASPGTVIGHVHLQVGDVASAEPFYVGLGFDVTARWPQALFLSSGGYHHHLAVNSWRSGGAGRRDPERAGLAALSLHYPHSGRQAVDPWGTIINLPGSGELP